jgi:hypothetical protein
VNAFWGADWPHDIVVVATGTDAEFTAQAGGVAPHGLADIAAVAVADHVDPVHRVALGQRIAFAPGASAMTDDALRIVLGHELFHYAARADTALDAPRWLTEGVADFVARPEPAGSGIPAPPRPPAVLPSDADLDAAGEAGSQAYDRAWWFARFVAEAYGTPKLRELYLRACGIGHPDVPTAVRDVLGIDLTDLVARWANWPTR